MIRVCSSNEEMCKTIKQCFDNQSMVEIKQMWFSAVDWTILNYFLFSVLVICSFICAHRSSGHRRNEHQHSKHRLHLRSKHGEWLKFFLSPHVWPVDTLVVAKFSVDMWRAAEHNTKTFAAVIFHLLKKDLRTSHSSCLPHSDTWWWSTLKWPTDNHSHIPTVLHKIQSHKALWETQAEQRRKQYGWCLSGDVTVSLSAGSLYYSVWQSPSQHSLLLTHRPAFLLSVIFTPQLVFPSFLCKWLKPM